MCVFSFGPVLEALVHGEVEGAPPGLERALVEAAPEEEGLLLRQDATAVSGCSALLPMPLQTRLAAEVDLAEDARVYDSSRRCRRHLETRRATVDSETHREVVLLFDRLGQQ